MYLIYFYVFIFLNKFTICVVCNKILNNILNKIDRKWHKANTTKKKNEKKQKTISAAEATNMQQERK